MTLDYKTFGARLQTASEILVNLKLGMDFKMYPLSMHFEKWGWDYHESNISFKFDESCVRLSWLQIFKSKYLHFHFDFGEGQSIKISSKYQNQFFNSKCQNIGCIDPDFCADFAIFLHFSRSTRIYSRKCVKMSKTCKNPLHQISENFRKCLKNGHILIFWLYFIL